MLISHLNLLFNTLKIPKYPQWQSFPTTVNFCSLKEPTAVNYPWVLAYTKTTTAVNHFFQTQKLDHFLASSSISST